MTRKLHLLLACAFTLALLSAASPAQAQGCAGPTNWWSKDELKANDYMLVFRIPNWARWRLVGSNPRYQSVIDKALRDGGLHGNYHNPYGDGTRVIIFSTGGKARWLNGYFGSLDDYRRHVGVYWW